MSVDEFDEKVKQMALKLYSEKKLKPSCDRCYYLSDPKCPDFPHRCALEEMKEHADRIWMEKNLPHRIEMRKAHLKLRSKIAERL